MCEHHLVFSIFMVWIGAKVCAKSVGFVYPMKNITATTGQDVNLRCQIASSAVDIRRSWTFHSAIIFANNLSWTATSRGAQLVSDTANDYTMQLKNVSPDDEGFYTCTVYDNTTFHATMYLSVNIPPSFIDVTANLEVDEGEDVILKCMSEGKPQPKITWRHLIPSADGVRATSEFLPLVKVSRGSGGKYECMADNGVSFPVKSSIKLTVNYPPEMDFDMSESHQAVPIDKPASIECIASASPKPEFTWHHPSGRITQQSSSNKDYTVINVAQDNSVQSSLFISKLKPTDYGSYICVASNQLGKANSTFVLKQKILPPTRRPPSVVFNQLISELDTMEKGSYSDGACSSQLNGLSGLFVFMYSVYFVVL